MRSSLSGFVLAAGKAKRMGVLCDPKANRFPIAKPALTVGRNSLIRQQLYLLQLMGITTAAIAVKHSAETVRRAIVRDNNLSIKTEIFDLNDLEVEDWGAAWTVSRWLAMTPDCPENLVVLNGDVVWDERLARPFIERFLAGSDWGQILAAHTPLEHIFGRFGAIQLKGEQALTIYHDYLNQCRAAAGDQEKLVHARMDYQAAWLRRVEQIAGQVVRVRHFQEKPAQSDYHSHVSSLANVGLFALKTGVFDRFAHSLGADFADFARHLFQAGMIKEHLPLSAFIATAGSYWRDIGTPKDLLRANFGLLNSRINLGYQGEEVRPGVWLGRGVEIPSAVLEQITPPVIISDDVMIGNKVRLGPRVVVGRGWRIGGQARVSNSLLLPAYYPEDRNRVIAARQAIDHAIIAGGTIDRSVENMIAVISPAGEVVYYDYRF
ncbi:hypothetical protein A2311_02275 [candidate division WOR-1 bacterium RIFOXYB2_FULL_48_7]|uniref:Nucleotidyl transferase domain-containing protein n=1 Tax=candidate division WOR-1 bacterium RIFOXYB2_FULL_48_7 TaxID=1802583 RepID=A0A1F4TLH4_UNCSA|nr:MAG: hypothetical protein A2311_02275 [candidate division WOR-1 bacterium RIFOXYB2_FULL_48_7]